MSNFTFADKSNSSNFVTTTGNKVNQVFSDLLLNRTELETTITSLRRQQYSASPPANPNTGDIWRCSITGGGYTAEMLYKYNGSAWVEAAATAINSPNRNTVIQGKDDGAGNPALFTGSGAALTVQLNATTTPAIFSFMNGNTASTAAVDIIAGVATDDASFWTSLPTTSTVYLYVNYSSGTLTGGFTTVAPVYQTYAPTHASGKHWIDFNTGKVWSSDGSAWTQRNRVFVGTVTTDGSKCTAQTVYAYNDYKGRSSNYLPLAGGTVTGLVNLAVGSNIASASTVNLSTATGNTVHITGTTGISAFTMTTGQVMDVIFDGALTLTHHATTNNLPSQANITTVAGDRARYFYDGTTVYCLQYQRKDGTAIAGGASAGQIIQVVSTTKTDTFTTTSSTWTDVTGLSVTITPSSSSNKIKVSFHVSGYSSTDYGIIRLVRGSTAISIGDGSSNRPGVSAAGFYMGARNEEQMIQNSGSYLDSPSTTSATTYKIQVLVASGTLYIGRSPRDGDYTYTGRAPSTIIVEEVKA